MNPTKISAQLTQLFTDKAAATLAYAKEVQQIGAANVRFYEMSEIQADDMRSNPPKLAVIDVAGNPLYAVQSSYP